MLKFRKIVDELRGTVNIRFSSFILRHNSFYYLLIYLDFWSVIRLWDKFILFVLKFLKSFYMITSMAMIELTSGWLLNFILSDENICCIKNDFCILKNENI